MPSIRDQKPGYTIYFFFKYTFLISTGYTSAAAAFSSKNKLNVSRETTKNNTIFL